MSKEWGEIDGYDGKYLCSKCGSIFNTEIGREISSRFNSTGYVRVNLYKDGKAKTETVHSLVIKTFIGKRDEGMQINHIDGDKTNNDLSNLEYVTPQENSEHAILIGLVNPVGSSNANSKLFASDVINICEKYDAGGVTQQQLADEYGIVQVAVSDILCGKRWSPLTGRKYNKKRKIAEKEDIERICHMIIDDNETTTTISKKTGISKGVIWSIMSGNSWVNISKNILHSYKKQKVLTTQKVLDIREKMKMPENTDDVLAMEYGVHKKTITRIRKRETWGNI